MAKLTGNLIPVPCPAASGMNGIITTKESISEQLSDVKWAIYRGGGGWSFCLDIFLVYFTKKMEIFISVCLLYLFQSLLSNENLFSPWLVAFYLCHLFSAQNYLFQEKLQTPPPPRVFYWSPLNSGS